MYVLKIRCKPAFLPIFSPFELLLYVLFQLLSLPTGDSDRPPSMNLTTIVAIAGGCFVLLLAILIIIIVIVAVRHSRKKLTQPENSYELPTTNIDELDGSPAAKRRSKSYSPNHKGNRESYNYVNTDYDREPYRAGSTPPTDAV